MTVSEKGMGKRTNINEFTVQFRGGKGIRCYKITEKTGDLVGAKLVKNDHDIMMITNEGVIIRIGIENISVIGRDTSGVKLMNIEKESDTRIVSIAKVRDDEKDQTEENDEEEFIEDNSEEKSE